MDPNYFMDSLQGGPGQQAVQGAMNDPQLGGMMAGMGLSPDKMAMIRQVAEAMMKMPASGGPGGGPPKGSLGGLVSPGMVMGLMKALKLGKFGGGSPLTQAPGGPGSGPAGIW